MSPQVFKISTSKYFVKDWRQKETTKPTYPVDTISGMCFGTREGENGRIREGITRVRV